MHAEDPPRTWSPGLAVSQLLTTGFATALLYLCGWGTPRRADAQQPSHPSDAPRPTAQQVTASPSGSTPGDSLAAQLAAITTDTGAFALGHRSFAAYTTPGFCLVAVRHTRDVARRSIAAQEALDTVRRHPAQDTLPAGVVAVARTCAAQFTAAGTAAADLPDLFALAVVAQQDSLAAAVLTRRLALAKSAGDQAALLLAAESTYLAAAPARVPAAEALVARLDALGTSAAVLPSRIAAHQRLQALGDSTADWGRVRHEAEQVLVLTRRLPRGSEAATAALLEAYRTLGRLASLQAPDSLPALARQLQQEAQHISSLHTYATLPLDTVVRRLSLVGDWPGIGQPTPPLHADFWFPAAATDTILPQPGRVSLFVELPEACYDSYDDNSYVLYPIETRCARMYNLVQQWHAQYGAAVDLTLVAVTTSRGGTVLSGPQTPAEAAKNLDWYFRQYLKLPVQHVAVQNIPRIAVPAPDGRLVRPAPYNARGYTTPFDAVYRAEMYRSFLDPILVLTGRDGRYWYGGGPSAVFEQLLARAILPSSQNPPAPPVTPATSPAPPAAVVHHQPGTL